MCDELNLDYHNPLEMFEAIEYRAKVLKADSSVCGPIAISLTTGEDYDLVDYWVKEQGYRKHNQGMYWYNIRKTVEEMGYTMTWVEKPDGAKTPISLQGKLNPNKKYMVEFKGHVAAVLNNVVQDWTNGRRHRILNIYEITKEEK